MGNQGANFACDLVDGIGLIQTGGILLFSS